MADKSINSLNPASALQDGDTLVVFQDSETKKMAGSVLRTYVENSAQPSVAAAAASAQAAEDSADAAEENALKAEGYATGTQNGVPVSDTSPYYLHNAQLYVTQARTARNGAEYAKEDVLILKKSAEAYATGTVDGEPVPSSWVQYHNNAKYYAEEIAGPAATAAAASAQAAADSADAAQDVLDSIPPDYTEATRRTLAAFPQESAEGSVVDFADGADELPVANLTVQIEGVQAGEGDPSPDNIRPITGWTGVDLRRTGKNLWGGAAMLADMKAAVPSAAVDETAGTIKYVATASVAHLAIGTGTSGITYVMRFKPNTRYTLIIKYSNSVATSGRATTNIAFWYTDGTYAIMTASHGFEADVPGTAAFTSAAGKSIKAIGKINSSATATIYTNESGLFEGVLTADDFEPYVGTSYPITFPAEAGTVCGGSLDVTTGVLTVTCKLAVLDGTMPFTKVDNANERTSVFILNQSVVNNKRHESNMLSIKTFANTMKKSSSLSYDSLNPNEYYWTNNTNGYWRIGYGTPDTTLEEFLAFLNNTPLQVACQLQSPTTYQLTPTEVTTLLGWNTLYADTDDVTVKYRADPQRYTDGRLAAVRKIISGVEDGFTATHNYAVDDFLIVGDALYRVTAAIATGGSIIPDTNVTATTVAEQLKALYASIS